MSTLVEIIHAEIAQCGPLPFRRFMELALYEPVHGYYASGRAVIGRQGDFMTSVSVGPLFGRLLATQFEEMWRLLGQPARFEVVEQGANNGDFAHDVLTASAASPAFYEALRYGIVEPFAANAARQGERLAPFAGRVSWQNSVQTLPAFTGVHFSNELVDALPVHCVVFRNGAWLERYVVLGDESGTLAWVDGPLSTPALTASLSHLPRVEGYETEISLEASAWLGGVSQRLDRGYVLIADYGFSRADYYLPERTQGTLACYRQHHRGDDLLAVPGEQDLTAHVDFTALAECAEQSGLTLAGFTDQHHFLAALGRSIFPDITDPLQLTPERQKEMRAFATLVHPTLMGRGFQFLALAKNAPADLRGYGLAAEPRRTLGME